MSLIKCPECSNSISDQATCCPSCGFPIRQTVMSVLTNLPLEWKAALFVLSIAFLIGGVLLLWYAVFRNSGEPSQLVFGLILFCQGCLNIWLLCRPRKYSGDIDINTD